MLVNPQYHSYLSSELHENVNASESFSFFADGIQAKRQGFLSRGQWWYYGRQIPEKYKPTAKVTGDNPYYVFSVDETVAIPSTPLYEARKQFCNIYLRECCKHKYLQKTPEGWLTLTQDCLTKEMLFRHVNCVATDNYYQNCFGVFAGYWTGFVLLDLDLHNRDRKIFLQQLRILFSLLNYENWHYQVNPNKINGVHFINTFAVPKRTDDVVNAVRNMLWRLDNAFPELKKKAQQAGMPSFAHLELFPSSKNGVRLPLGVERQMLLDMPLELKFGSGKRKDKLGQDVVGYVNWLNQANKKRMSVKELVSFVEQRLPEQEKVVIPEPTKVTHIPTSENKLGKLKGCFWNTLTGWLKGELPISGSLNEGLLLCARGCLCAFTVPDEEEACIAIRDLVDAIPDKSFSSKFNNSKELDRQIKLAVKKAYRAYFNPISVYERESVEKLKITRACWMKAGMDFLNKETWNSSKHVEIEFNFTEEQIQEIQSVIPKVIKTKEVEPVEFVSGVLKVVAVQERLESGMCQNFWKKCFEDLCVKCGDKNKRNNILRTLIELKLIRQLTGEMFGRGKGVSRRYGIHQTVTHWIV